MRKVSDSFAERIRDNLFTDEEKALLNSQVGSLYIDIKDQFLNYYGNRCFIYDEDTTFINFAVLKDHRGAIYLDKLREYQSRLKTILDPKAHRMTVVKKGDVAFSSGSEIDLKSTNKHKSKSYQYAENEGIVRQGTSTLDRSLEGANSQKIEGDPIKDSSEHEFLKLKMNKKKITVDLSREEVSLGNEEEGEVNDLSMKEMVLPQGRFARVATSGTLSKSSGINENVSNAFNWSQDSGEGQTETKSISNSNKEFNSNREEYVEADIASKILNVEIPRVKTQFWNVFSVLFKVSRW